MSTIKYQTFNFLTESLEDKYVTDQPELVMKTTNNGTEYEGFSSLINSGITSFPSRQWYVGSREKYATGILIKQSSYVAGDTGYHVSIWPTNPDQYYKTVSQINGDTNKIKIKVNIMGLVNYLENKYGEDQIDYSDPSTTIFRSESMYAWISGITIHQFENTPTAYEWKEDETTHISSWIRSTRVINRTIESITISIKDLKSNTVIERNYISQGVSGDNTYQENVFVICTLLLCVDFNPNYTAYDYNNPYVRYINNNGSVVQKDENDELIYSSDTGRLAYPLFDVYEGNEHLIYNNDRSSVYISPLSESYADKILDNVYGIYGMSTESYATLNGGTITYIDINGNTQSYSTSGTGFYLHNMKTLPIAYNDSTYTMMIANAIVNYDEIEPEPGEEGKYIIQIKFRNDSDDLSKRPATVNVQGRLELSDAHVIDIDETYNVTSNIITDEIELGEGITIVDYNIEFELIDNYTLDSDINDTTAVAIYTLINSEIDPDDFDPEVNYPEAPEDVQNLPTPETPQDNSELLDYLKGYIDGQLRQGNFENEEQTPGDLILPANARNASWYSASHPFSTACFIGTPTDMSEMVEKIFTCTDCFLAEALLAISKNFDPSKVIQRILEYPFSTNYMSRALTITQAAPAWNKTCLTWDPVHVNHTVLLAIWAAIITQGNATGTAALTAAMSAFESATNIAPSDLEMPLPWGTPHYYDIALKRFFEVDYGTVTINKIFGSFLDYTDVNYNIQIPISNEIIKLDNHMLFEDYTGNEKDQQIVIGIKGIVDLETGDMLLSITRDNDLMYQTTLNVAVDRNYYTKDSVASLRDLAQGLSKVASGVAMMTMPTAIGSSVGTTQKAALNMYMSPEGQARSLKATGERGISNTDYERMSSFRSGSTMVDGIIDIARGGMPAEVKVGMGNNAGTTKLLGNQFPILIYDYPEIMIPNQGPYSNPGPWDYTFNYYEEAGLPSSTTKVGRGFNKYGAITNVDLNWTYSWSHEELQGFKEDLLRGFYIYDEDNIYRSPGVVYTELFNNPDRYKYSPEPPGYTPGQGMTQGYEATNSIVLVNVFSNWEKYIDRFHPDNLQYSIQGGHYYICYNCNVYRDMNIDKPVIDISSEIYTHQNTAIWNGRIYRVANVDYLPGHIVRLHLQEDYITTWYYFGVVEGIITRSTSYGISNMKDDLPKTVRRIVKRKKFEGGITNADLGTTFVTVCTPTIVMPSNQNEQEE